MSGMQASSTPLPVTNAAPAPRITETQRLLRRMARTPAIVAGASVVLLLILVAVAAPLLTPHSPLFQDYDVILESPSWTHPFGTDNLGRDVLTRLLYGARVSLQVGVIAVGIAAVAGIFMGLLGGFYGGWLDDLIMRIADAMIAFPALLLVLAIAAALGPSITNTMVAIGVVSSPYFARLLRAQVLSARATDYVLAARALGCRPWRIMLRHILPNTLSPIIVLASLSVANAIMTEATLSFLGVGTPPPAPSWGGMLQTGFQYLQLAPWLSTFPGLAIFITVLAFNILGDGLRAVLDPRMR
jgi:peptide/nickel transport system permease protein